MNAFRNAGFACFLGLSIVGSSFAATRCVNVSNATPAAPYTTWASASTSIQAAIDAAVNGDEILVAPGVYPITSTLQIPVEKALTLRSTQSRAAIVDAQGLCAGLYVVGTNSVIEGFTFRNGVSGGYGGGVYLGRASTLRDCLVTSNRAWGAGGVMMQDNGAVVENCAIVSNEASYWGGGVVIYNYTTGLVKDSDICNNVAGDYAGGVAFQGAGTVSNCWIADNQAVLQDSGGVNLALGGTLVNCVVVGNQAQTVAGGVYATAGNVLNCTIIGNSAVNLAGGGLYLSNVATSRNCIVYYNAAPATANVQIGGSPVLDRCCTVPAAGVDAITNEPGFANRLARDFHLLPGSPCIDAGTAEQAPGDDYDGNPRPVAGQASAPALFDVGAYEYGRAPLMSADFDGDGATDLVVYHPATGNWHGLLSAMGGQTLPFGWSAALPTPADFDGDGMADLAVYHPATGNWHIRESSSAIPQVTQFGWSATVPLPGDYDGDGKADLAVYHPTAGRWYFLCSTAGRYDVQWGWSSAIPVPADYDGDGITDIAVYHPASGLWQILKSSTGGAIQKNWGWSSAIPVPADYDGDGRADVAVFHRASGTWYVAYSGGGSLTQPFGWSTTIPVAADYDGDGRADIAVYHPASGNWSILKSTTGGIRTQNWGWSATQPVLLYPLIHSWFGLP